MIYCFPAKAKVSKNPVLPKLVPAKDTSIRTRSKRGIEEISDEVPAVMIEEEDEDEQGLVEKQDEESVMMAMVEEDFDDIFIR